MNSKILRTLDSHKRYVNTRGRLGKTCCWAVILNVLGSVAISALPQTARYEGVVKDSLSGEVLPYVSVIYKNTKTGAMTDNDGRFSLPAEIRADTLSVFLLGYAPKFISIPTSTTVRVAQPLEILLTPTIIDLDELVVKPKRERYRRKDNPAVDLIREVIQRKDSNRITMRDKYQVECYEKLALSLDQFEYDFETNKLLSKFKFVQKHLDTSAFNGKPILTLSLRERLSEIRYRKDPYMVQQTQLARRQSGIDETLDSDGNISANLDEILKPIDPFENDMTFLLNRFVSPLSSTLATLYYHYYILDTVVIDSIPCIDMAFVPANPQSYSFTGHLFIVADSTRAVKQIQFSLPYHLNINYITNLKITQNYQQHADHLWALEKEDTYLTFSVLPGSQQVYAYQLRSFRHYADTLTTVQHTPVVNLKKNEEFWLARRHVPVKEKENALENLLTQLKTVPVFNVFIKMCEVLISGYVPTSGAREENKLDFGPLNTTFSSNDIEGIRLRVGGYTTANFHPHIYLGGYAAYGMADRRVKYQGKVTYAFNKKEYHENETPVNNLSLLHEFDIYTPGQDFLFTSKDNMFVAWKIGPAVTRMNYLQTTKLTYQKDFPHNLNVELHLQHQQYEPAGTLRYFYHATADQYARIYRLSTNEAAAQLRYAPDEKAFNSRQGTASILNLAKDAPVFTLAHHVGYLKLHDCQYTYHRTELGMKKRVWLSAFGNVDVHLRAGKIWNKVPFPLLVMPNTNRSITIQPEAFHLMNPMEFVADQYLSLDATYHLKGLILNRIPIINLLQLREVVSFNAITGSLADKNNPNLTDHLFLFPADVHTFQKQPYMEVSAGLENVFGVLQINYYRRLNYLQHNDVQRNGIRIALKFDF